MNWGLCQGVSAVSRVQVLVQQCDKCESGVMVSFRGLSRRRGSNPSKMAFLNGSFLRGDLFERLPHKRGKSRISHLGLCDSADSAHATPANI